LKLETETGKGTTFEIYLPAAPKAKEPAGSLPAGKVPSGHDELILVVDDEPGIRDICARMLRREGHEVETAASGEDAVARLSTPFDIVLTDLTMPGEVDGNELARRVREAGNADVLIMTAYPELDSAIEAMRGGAYDYLVKPFTEETLRMSIQRCVDKRNLSRELAREKSLRAELSQMAKVRDIFGQFATPEVAKLVLEHPDDFWKRGERTVVTVLFADVRGFTPYAGRVPPEEAVQALNQVFEGIIAAIRGEGGILNKFIGDGMMALFGAPVASPDHAAAAGRAALKACEAVDLLAVERKAQGLEPLRIGLGINTGEVVAGCLGTRERTEYSVIGHAVNVASRMEEAAKPGQILIGPETAKLLGPSFEFNSRGLMHLQGLSEPVEVFELLGYAARLKAP